METVIPGLYATDPQPLSFAPQLGVRSFLLEREGGNVLVYSSGEIKNEEEYLRGRGGVWRQYFNHGHEARAGEEGGLWVKDVFGAPLYVHEDDSEEVSGVQEVDGIFSNRHTVGNDFEVIPTPGHTPGATAFLWDSGEHRALFTGDSIALEDGEWVAALLSSSDRESYLKSLDLIRTLDFDVLVPWAASMNGDYYAFTDAKDTDRRIDGILEKMSRD